jgi:hypothetical protein
VFQAFQNQELGACNKLTFTDPIFCRSSELEFWWNAYPGCVLSRRAALRRNCVKLILAHKNFARAVPSVEAATLQNFPRFPCFPWTKKMGCGGSPRQAFSCGSWLKNTSLEKAKKCKSLETPKSNDILR